VLFVALLALLPAAGCARAPRPTAERRRSLPLAVQVYADTGRGGRLSVRPQEARAWLARVTPTRICPRQAPALPEAAPESLPPLEDAMPVPQGDAGLQPPVLRTPAPTCLRQVPARPAGRSATAAWVDLDVRVDEAGAVSDALWVDGSTDTALVEAARHCALSMRFYPALRAGRAVAVWCRQRCDLRAAGGGPRAGR
jgi:hypothetical protein